MLWVLVFLGIVASALFSGAESAFVACPKLKIRHLARQGVSVAQRLEKAMADPGPYLSTLLVGTNLANVGGTVAAARLAEGLFPGKGDAVATAVMVPLFLVLSEILPKSYFLAHARSLCLRIFVPLAVLRRGLQPLIVLVGAPARLLGMTESEANLPITREELVLLARLGRKQTRLSGAVSHLLEKRVAAARPIASEIMIPAHKVAVLPYDITVEAALPMIEASGFTRYPLDRGGNWHGLVHVVDIVGSLAATPLELLAHPIPAVAGDAQLEDIIETMRTAGEHVVIVRESMRNVGLLTLDDVVRHFTSGLDPEVAQ